MIGMIHRVPNSICDGLNISVEIIIPWYLQFPFNNYNDSIQNFTSDNSIIKHVVIRTIDVERVYLMIDDVVTFHNRFCR